MESTRLHGSRTSCSSGNNMNREKKFKRKEVNSYCPLDPFAISVDLTFMSMWQILEKKKALDELVKAAYSEKDHLASLPSFRFYDRNGLSVYLESGHGDKLKSPVKNYIKNLLKVNMEGPYGSEWPMEEKVKYREMVAPDAYYIFVHEAPSANTSEISTMLAAQAENSSTSCIEDKGPLVGFVQYRFTVEEEIPVAYVYELQLEPCVQGKGLGKFLMQIIELIARKNQMGAVMLTVQKANLVAMEFYIRKMRYVISAISPSRVDPMLGIETSYEILCKAFDHEAKTILEVNLFLYTL
ncbi:N-alpha-acetyltransferase 40 [Quillaja saponaria]|uniref:N-alpha-acetyltransferase 40 n=1 Tax=Quillaja saponaria TaxID=32244 RepID=A0AAD7M7W7_QUISA|nr:N-alpha-acetyltransferase 40 [Quillaja saponaria]